MFITSFDVAAIPRRGASIMDRPAPFPPSTTLDWAAMDAPGPEAGTTDSDDEGDHWLWDLEDRYDVGAVDESFPRHLIATGDDTRLAQVRRYRRSRHDAAGSGFGRIDGEATATFDTVADGLSEPHHIRPAVAPRHRTNRWAVAAAVVVVAGLGGAAWAASHHGGHSGGPNLAVATPTTLTTASSLVGPPGVAVTAPTSSDTAAPPPAATFPTTPAPTVPANRFVFTPTATTVAPRTTPTTARTTKAPTPTTSPPRTTPPPTTAPPPTTPPPTTVAPKPPPPTTVPTGTTTPPITSAPPSTVPLGG